MGYQIDARKVLGVVVEANAALVNKDFNQGEVILGLSELIGRIMVETAETHLQLSEMVKVMEDHVQKTITVGWQARNKGQIITEV